MSERNKSILTSYDGRMVRYIAGVSWEDGLRSEEVVERCAMETLDVLLRRRSCNVLAMFMKLVLENT